MDWDALVGQLSLSLGETLPSIVAALGFLVMGWLVAVVARAVVRG